MSWKLTLKNLDLYIYPQKENFESIVAQLQTCQPEAFFYVRNGVQMGIYKTLDEIPSQPRVLELETKATAHIPAHYYIRETETQDLICCWHPALRDRLLASKPSLNLKPNGPVVIPITTWQQF